jgi:copper chaperone CopZ
LRNRDREAFAIVTAPGINIAGGAEKLSRELSKLDGILDIEINYILDTVSIRYDSDRVTLAKIKQKINT